MTWHCLVLADNDPLLTINCNWHYNAAILSQFPHSWWPHKSKQHFTLLCQRNFSKFFKSYFICISRIVTHLTAESTSLWMSCSPSIIICPFPHCFVSYSSHPYCFNCRYVYIRFSITLVKIKAVIRLCRRRKCPGLATLLLCGIHF